MLTVILLFIMCHLENISSDWTNYEIAKTFTLSVPNTVELRGQDDFYTKELKRGYYKNKINFNDIAFQQKGLSYADKEALKTYCRVLIKVVDGEGFPSSSDCYELTQEDISYFRSMAIESAYPFKIIGNPVIRWTKVSGSYGIEVKYTRKGENNTFVNVSSYYFFNIDKVVTIVLAYRKEDSAKWKDDFSKIINTFRWIEK
ncbi:MAG: hypothetical protein J6B46_07965 [Parabacteroides sp.]|nr:hypothetical protein [Parabacteroides sp.]